MSRICGPGLRVDWYVRDKVLPLWDIELVRTMVVGGEIVVLEFLSEVTDIGSDKRVSGGIKRGIFPKEIMCDFCFFERTTL